MSLRKKASVIITDGYKIELSNPIEFYQYDQIELLFEIDECNIEIEKEGVFNPLNTNHNLKAKLLFNTIYNNGAIDSASIEQNIIRFYLSIYQTENIGTIKMQLQLYDDDGCKITFPPFNCTIKENIYGDRIIHMITLSDDNDCILVDENGYAICLEKYIKLE